MGYILPIRDFQAIQYTTRSLQNNNEYFFVNKVKEVTKQSQFSRDLERRHQQSNLRYWKRLKSHKFRVDDSTLTSYDLNIADVTCKGLKYNFYV